jgi:acetate kinase
VKILALNAGSSTLKFRLMEIEAGADIPLVEGVVDRVGTPDAALRFQSAGQASEVHAASAETAAQAVEIALNICLPSGIDAMGFRVVHGGALFSAPALLNADTLEAMCALNTLAPLHNPVALAGIEAALLRLPDVPAVAVFDTAFHSTLPEVAWRYALPFEMCDRLALRRYGFHGISHRYVSERLLDCLGRSAEGTRLITLHLGNGASVCAIRDGKSVDTSMGLTPLEGLIMGSRCGDVDPGLLLYLLRAENFSVETLDDLLNRQSGLRGLSGRSGDMRDLEQAAQTGDSRAEHALEAFAYRVRKYIGAYAAALEGLDAVAFTGGIGEHSVAMRARICRGMTFLGITLDAERNALTTGAEPARISADESAAPLWVIPTDEQLQIARETWQLLKQAVTP